MLPYQISLQALTTFVVLVGGSLLLLKLLRVLELKRGSKVSLAKNKAFKHILTILNDDGY
jgi:hypothetical protein